MDNSNLLVQASSGLERLMGGTGPGGTFKDSTVAQVSAYVYYQANVIAKLTSSREFQNTFTTTIFEQIDKDFGNYVDALARTRPKSLHHVYEWKRVGNPKARLFKLNKISEQGLSFKLNYEFIASRSMVPAGNSKRRHMFPNKAAVMESGMPLVIRPKNAERLVFEYNGETVFMPKGAAVTIRRPGGPAATNQFVLAYSRFFSGQLVNASIKNSGFQSLFNSRLTKAMKLPASIKKVQYKFSPNMVRSQADSALALAFGGAL